MATAISAPKRLTSAEWEVSAQSQKARAEHDRRELERLVNESKRIVDFTKEQSHKTNRDVNKKLEQRIDQVEFFKKELEDHLAYMVNEIDALEVYFNRIAKMKENVQEPLHIVNQCLAVRENRIGSDLVHDDVQKELLKELEVYHGVLEMLEKCYEQCREQLRLNRKSRFNVENDILSKDMSRSLDDRCRALTEHHPQVDFRKDAAKILPTSVTYDDWQYHSEENCKRLRQQLQNSKQVRTLLDHILQQVVMDMKRQIDATNLAFHRRIADIKAVKAKFEHELDNVLDDIRKADDNLIELEKAVAEKEAPLKLAQTRLSLRQEKPGIELCRDPAQYRMISQMGELEQAIMLLQDKIGQTRKARQNLMRTAEELRDEIAGKAKALHIDEVECMTMRAAIAVEA